tara:strand:- start:350 stop:1324 length:975 start_codon:yes stop_codon:yes gene_type:complete
MNNNISKYKKIKKVWLDFKSNEKNKKIRIRDAAKQLGVSEAELLSTEIGSDIYYLSNLNIKGLIENILSADKIMSLIRSDIVVHEKNISCDTINLNNNNSLIFDDGTLLLNFKLDSFKHVFYERKNHNKRELRSFQFFNKAGQSLLKIYLKGHSSKLFDDLGEKYKVDYGYELQEIDDSIIKKTKNTLSNIDMYFSKNIYDSIEKRKLSDKKIFRKILEYASEKDFPFQIHALGMDAIQYHRGTVKNILDYGPWINVIDKSFNIHVLENSLYETYLYKFLKNNTYYYSIEFFDKMNQHVLGSCSVENYENEFCTMINKIGVMND